MEQENALRERMQAAVKRGLDAWSPYPDEDPQILRINHLVGSIYHLTIALPPPLETVAIDALYLDGPEQHSHPLFLDSTGLALVMRRNFERGRDI